MNSEADLDLMREILNVGTEPSPRARREARVTLLEAIDAEDRGRPASRRRRRLRSMGARRVALVAGALVVGATGATAATVASLDGIGHATPTQLFKANPDRLFAPWVKQSLVAGTVRRVETVNVPGVGAAQYWTAQATHHGICVGLRLPGGVWAGSYNRFELGGPVPGCVYHFSPDPKTGWSPQRGFYQVEYQAGGRWNGRITIGTVPSVGRPVSVRDVYTGTTARVIDGRYFAILIPPAHGQWGSWKQGHAVTYRLRYRLETLDASGHVLARDFGTVEP